MYPRAASLPALRRFRLEHGAHSRNGAEDTVYRLTARSKKSHKSAAHRPVTHMKCTLRVFTGFLLHERKLNTALIRGFLHCRIPFSRRAWGGRRPARCAAAAARAGDIDKCRGFSGQARQKGKAMLWISGGISVALFIYLFHALIKPERY
ncbi:K(+)-transporting ATPase subunit F [Burkholderia ubonensis]|uniref:K(+)-transporting ATPase subunit F n=2 Tax=Burkholderia ubonensis TaxID=101571 RepID=UPI0009B4585E